MLLSEVVCGQLMILLTLTQMFLLKSIKLLSLLSVVPVLSPNNDTSHITKVYLNAKKHEIIVLDVGKDYFEFGVFAYSVVLPFNFVNSVFVKR